MGLLSRVPVFVLRMVARITLMRGEPRGEVEYPSQPASQPARHAPK